MTVPDEPMVGRWGTTHPSAPLVVALHGNGTSEHSMIEIAPWLPHGPVAYVTVRAPMLAGTGFCWYREADPDGRLRRGAASAELAVACRWLLRWLDTEGDPDRPVLLLGFREGVTVAGELMFAAPERFAGAVLLYGALGDLPSRPAPLAGMPVFLAHGTDDTRTSPEGLARTWEWLTRRSGAPVWAERGPGGAQLAGDVVGGAGRWLADRLDHLRAHGENPLPDGDEPAWPGLGRLTPRAGTPPEVTERIPQHQVCDLAPPPVADALWERLAALDGVTTGPTTVGVAGSRSLRLDRASCAGPDRAFVLPVEGELAHQHPDGSLHVALPDALAYDALAKGWAVAHPLAGLRVAPGLVLVPGPRDDAELGTIAAIIMAAHDHAAYG